MFGGIRDPLWTKKSTITEQTTFITGEPYYLKDYWILALRQHHKLLVYDYDDVLVCTVKTNGNNPIIFPLHENKCIIQDEDNETTLLLKCKCKIIH